MAKRNLRTCGDAFRIVYIAKGSFQNMLLKDGKLISTIYGMQYRTGGDSLKNQLYLGKRITLKPEPDNPVDPCAIAVWDGDSHLGYIPRKDIPVVMSCVADSGTTAVVDKLDDGIVGVEIEPTFKYLGKRPWMGLDNLTFIPVAEYSDDASYVYGLNEMDEEEFLNSYTYKSSSNVVADNRYSNQKKTKESTNMKYIGKFYFCCGSSYEEAKWILEAAELLHKDISFVFVCEHGDVYMKNDVLGMSAVIPYDVDDAILLRARRAAINGKRVKMIPDITDKSEYRAFGCKTYIQN